MYWDDDISLDYMIHNNVAKSEAEIIIKEKMLDEKPELANDLETLRKEINKRS